MATCGDTPVHFLDICKNSIYFEVECENDLEEDGFNKRLPCNQHDQAEESYWLRSSDHRFLLFKENEFKAEHLPISQKTQPGCKFKIQIYYETPKRCDGRAAILYVQVDDTDTRVVCCDEQRNIVPKKMAIPDHLPDPKHEAVFYMTRCISSYTVRFRPSVEPNKYLGFAHISNPGVNKLVLCSDDDVDGSCDMLRENCS